MAAPLTGIVVLDMTTVVAGPYCGALLSDMGAAVTKVEAADGRGDTYRFAGTARVAGGTTKGAGEILGASFATVNRGKRSLALDAKAPGGREVLLRLAAKADVFLQNMRPGVAERLGLSYEQLRAANPRLVYVSISGFGPTGPLSGDPVYDPLVQARSGIVATQQRIGDEARSGHHEHATLMNTVLVDKTTAMTAANAVTAALYARDAAANSGGGREQGQHIQVSMLDVAMQFNWPDLFSSHTYVERTPADANMALKTKEMLIQEGYAAFPCRGGRAVVFSANAGVMIPHKWEAICKGLGLHRLLKGDEGKKFGSPGRRMRLLREIFRAFDGGS